MVCVMTAAKTEGNLPLPVPEATVALSGFARAKSRSLAPHLVSITLPGFRSRCTTPARCAFSRASAISMPILNASSAARGFFPQSLGQRFALRELHDQVVDGAFVAHIVEHADMRMLKLGDDLGFAFKTGAQFRASHQLSVQYFDRNRAFQSRVPGAVHLAHAARAERRFDFVGAKSGARG
jgi:hypothetical protein